MTDAERKPVMGRPPKTHRHGMIAEMAETESMREISRKTGWTYNQVRYSVNLVLLGVKR